MSEPPEKRVKSEVADLILNSWHRKLIFDKIYGNYVNLGEDDELFKMSLSELAASSKYHKYDLYYSLLKSEDDKARLEADKARLEEEKSRLEAEKAKFEEEKSRLEAEKAKFELKIGSTFLNAQLSEKLCHELGSLLFGLNDKTLSKAQKLEAAKIIINILEESKFSEPQQKELLRRLNLEHLIYQNTRVPLNTKNKICPPSSMNGQIQILSVKDARNFIYPFPYGIIAHFPVFFCHPVFSNFMDIVHDRNSNNPVVIEYKNFMKCKIDKRKMDDCFSDLIVSVLGGKQTKSEKDFVNEVVLALSHLFPSSNVKSNFDVKSEITDLSPNLKIDAAVVIGDFPFIIIEAKNNSYSINAVLQGCQYYGLVSAVEFIDNDPGFIVTIDNGIFYLYGVAKVNCRVVCSCLLSLEFTNYYFNIEGFSDTLYRCISGLYFFYDRFESRISGKNDDLQHNKYLAVRSVPGFNMQPFPAIFSIQSELNVNERIEITSFGNENVVQGYHHPYFKPCVYLVNISGGRNAVLKIANDYDIETHRKLSSKNFLLAPEIIGYEKIGEQYHVILMEYFDDSYETIFDYCRDDKIPTPVNKDHLAASLTEILKKLESLKIVHGDFRSSNILAKRSESDPSILEKFKLIDFEFSGKVDEPYPLLALRNREITWPEGFNSYEPRKFDHDKFMLNEIIRKDL